MFKSWFIALVITGNMTVFSHQVTALSESDWIDPSDMVNYESGSKSMVNQQDTCDCEAKNFVPGIKYQQVKELLETCSEERKTLDTNNETTLRKYITSLILNFDDNGGSYQMQVTLTKAHMAALKSFTSSHGRIDDAQEVLTSIMFNNLIKLGETKQLTDNFNGEIIGIIIALFLFVGLPISMMWLREYVRPPPQAPAQRDDDGVRDDGGHDDVGGDDVGVRDVGVRDVGVRDVGVRDDGVHDDGVRDDGVRDDGVSDDGVRDDGVRDDGVHEDNRLDDGGLDNDCRDDDGGRDTGARDDGVHNDDIRDDGVRDDDVGIDDSGLDDGGHDAGVRNDDSVRADSGHDDRVHNDGGRDDGGHDDEEDFEIVAQVATPDMQLDPGFAFSLGNRTKLHPPIEEVGS